MRQCNLLSKYLLPKYPDSEKKCLSISRSVRSDGSAHTKDCIWALHCCSWVTFPCWISAALSEGLLLLSVESLCTLYALIFCWLESNSQTLQDVANTDTWAKGSQCVLNVCSQMQERKVREEEKCCFFNYCRVT